MCLLAALCALPALAQESHSYRGLMRIPVALRAADGTRLDPGQYETEVKIRENHFTLTLLQAGAEKAHVEGRIRDGNATAMSAPIPLVGTSYLRSTADPVATAQERQFSKSGRAQYEEESREWKATMRVYKSRDGQNGYFEFQEKRGKGEWQLVEFGLLLEIKPTP